MYERSAIVLEKYLEKVLKLNKTYNLKKNSENYGELVNEIEQHQLTINKDAKIIQDFDNTVARIESIQREQQKLYKINKKLEDDRTQLFAELGEDAKTLENKLRKIETSLESNSKRMLELREEFIKNLKDFAQKQKYRNKCDKERRVSEAKSIKRREELSQEFKEIDVQDIVNLKDFISSEKEQVKVEALNIMIKNGNNERVPFNQDVLRKAINNRIDIAEKEAECYVLMYDRMKKLLRETDNEMIKLDKYKRILKDCTVRLAFLKAQREYIVGFLDYERMTAINGERVHKRMMIEACNNFELDMIQIKKLYELILRESAKKATKAAYKQLYNKNYLRNIEDKEKNFEEEANNVNVKAGTLLNSNYWRIEGIKNIYMVFQKEVSEKYEKDLSEYSIGESDATQDANKQQTDEEEKEYKEELKNTNKEETKNEYMEKDYEDEEHEEEPDEEVVDEEDEEEPEEYYEYEYEYEIEEDDDDENDEELEDEDEEEYEVDEELDEEYDEEEKEEPEEYDEYEYELEEYDDDEYEEESEVDENDDEYGEDEEELEEYEENYYDDDDEYEPEEYDDDEYEEDGEELEEEYEENYYKSESEDYDEYNYKNSYKKERKSKDRISDSFDIDDINDAEDLDQLIKNSRKAALQKTKKVKNENKSKKIGKQNMEVKQNKKGKENKAKKPVKTSKLEKHSVSSKKSTKKDNKGLLNKLFKK